MVYIILVNYNGCEDTIECVQSLSEMDYEEYRIVVVDNGSSDDSLEKLNLIRNDKIIVIDAQMNLGFSGGNNVGINYALEHGAEYILLLNNDTIVQKNFLRELVCTAREYDNKAVITSKILYAFDEKSIWYAGGIFNSITSRTSSIGIHELDEGQYDICKVVSFVSGCCMFIPVGIIREVGLMSEEYFLYCEDTDFCCRIMKKGYQLVYQPSSVIFHKVSASTTKLNELMNYYIVRNKLIMVRKHIRLRYKGVAYGYVIAESIKRIIGKEYSFSAVAKAFNHFRKGIRGRV